MKHLAATLALLVVTGLPATSQAAPLSAPGDECTVAPTLVRQITQAEPEYNRTPGFVGSHVWFGESVLTPDGTVVGTAPQGTPRGEVPPFNTATLNTQTVTWGVVVDTDSGAAVFSSIGVHLFDLPISIHAEAVYAEGLILVADWGDVSSHLERVLLVTQDGNITEITNEANGFDAFGTVLNGTIYVVLRDGGIATFDTAGISGPIISPAIQFTSVVTANGYLYAYSGGSPGSIGGDTTLHVFDGTGAMISEVALGGSAVRIGPTALGVAADIFSPSRREGIAAVATAPNGAGLTVLIGLHDEPTPYDRLAWHQGRYLIGLDALAEPEDGVSTVRLELYRLDGTPLSTSTAFDYRTYPTSKPAGHVLPFVGADGQSIDFRSLSGTLLDTVDYSGGPTPEIEAIESDDHYIWITTEATTQDQLTVYVYDLGACSGTPDPGRFIDDDWSIFADDIEWLATEEITYGCNPQQANTRFCPDDTLTRGQMAALLHRALSDTVVPSEAATVFTDTTDSIFHDAIEWLSGTGITQGCGTATFCPDEEVTRGQMAAFLTRALDLAPVDDTNRFVDDDHSIFEGAIASLASAGITSGCGPDRFCPEQALTRGEMAAFLRRALDY